MKTHNLVLLVLLALVLVPSAAATAQERGQTGLSMGYPASVSLLWHATDRFALRPEFALSRGSSDSSGSLSGSSTTSSGWAVGAGLSALFYVTKWEQVSTYVCPRFSYSRTTSSSSYNGVPTVVSSTDNTGTSYVFQGSFGAQYTPVRRFGVFGEVGLGYTYQKSTTTTSSYTSKGRTTSTRTAAGVIFYF